MFSPYNPNLEKAESSDLTANFLPFLRMLKLRNRKHTKQTQ